MSEEERNKKREYGKNRYPMSEEKKQKLKEYQKIYHKSKKRKQNILTFFLFIL